LRQWVHGVRLDFMDVQEFLQSLRDDPDYRVQIVHVHTEPARDPVWAPLPDGLLPAIPVFLKELGVSRLYQHQADAIRALLEGDNLLLATGTASGKSLCYQIPLLQQLLQDPHATGLLVFPTKALAGDQAEKWNGAVAGLPGVEDPRSLFAVPFDGDSDASDRRVARDSARLLVTNPEMIHANLLPGHSRWQRFLHGLKFVVLDEVHTYTGFFGANMANVIRRLDRICEHYGGGPRTGGSLTGGPRAGGPREGAPQYVCSSATIGNPNEVAELLVNRPFRVIDRDSSVSGTRTFVFWNPPRIKQRQWRGRRSANVEAHELMAALVERRVPTICFSKARNTAEMIYRYVRERLAAKAPGMVDRVIPYRGGYSGHDRRHLERQLREGKLLGVSATRALELGIDIGMLDACIIVGYPGILNAFLQQAGRAGRGRSDTLCILVGIDTPINQYIMQHPEYVFERPLERVVIDRDNPFVVLGHVHCASAELPVTGVDVQRFGYAAPLALDVLEEHKKVYHGGDIWYHASSEQPAFDVRLRGWGDESTVVTDIQSGRVIDRLDKYRAMRIFYKGAVYFHQGDTYDVVEHDTDKNLVTVRKVDVSYYTDPATGTAVDHIDSILDQRPLATGKAFLGEVYARLDTPVYERVRFYTMDRISQHPTGLPSIAYEAMAFWIEPPEELMQQVRMAGLDPESGLLGILLCVSRILPLFLTCDQNDFDWSRGCRNSPWQTMFWFEFYAHGVGNSEQCYDRLEEILPVALEHLVTCDCDDGCPNCTSRLITPYHVRNIELGEGDVSSRRAAVVVLNSFLKGASVEESVRFLDAPREKRGQRYLPSVVDRPRLSEPHHMPLNDRTRALLSRKMQRSELRKQDVDHPIELNPVVGQLNTDRKRSVAKPQEGSSRTIHRSGDPLTRKLRQRLSTQSPGEQPREQPTPPQSNTNPVIQAGDSVARRAKLRHKGSPTDKTDR